MGTLCSFLRHNIRVLSTQAIELEVKFCERIAPKFCRALKPLATNVVTGGSNISRRCLEGFEMWLSTAGKGCALSSAVSGNDLPEEACTARQTASSTKARSANIATTMLCSVSIGGRQSLQRDHQQHTQDHNGLETEEHADNRNRRCCKLSNMLSTSNRPV